MPLAKVEEETMGVLNTFKIWGLPGTLLFVPRDGQ
jgi:hypothetical protein